MIIYFKGLIVSPLLHFHVTPEIMEEVINFRGCLMTGSPLKRAFYSYLDYRSNIKLVTSMRVNQHKYKNNLMGLENPESVLKLCTHNY